MSTPTKQLEEFSTGYDSESVDDDQYPSPGTAIESFKPGTAPSTSGAHSPHSTGSPVSSGSKSLSDVESQVSTLGPSVRKVRLLERIKNFDIRPKLPSWISRFLGYRKEGIHRPIWALRWLDTLNVPIVVEEYFFAVFCTSSGVIGVVAINTTTFFASLPIPLSLGSVGALAIILSVNPHSPPAAPRNVILSHLFASLLATAVAKLFLTEEGKTSVVIAGQLSNQTVWCWAAFVTTVNLLFQKSTGFIHPPAGATALIGTIQSGFIRIGWRYMGFVMTSVLFMLAMALFWGNIGRGAYPDYWFIAPPPPSSSSFRPPATGNSKKDGSVDQHASSRSLDEGSYQSAAGSSENLTVDSHLDSDNPSKKSLSLSIRAS